MPREIVTKLNAETIRVVQRREVQDWLAQQGMDASGGSSEDFAAKIKTDMEKLSKVVRESAIRLD